MLLALSLPNFCISFLGDRNQMGQPKFIGLPPVNVRPGEPRQVTEGMRFALKQNPIGKHTWGKTPAFEDNRNNCK